jgi:hypothetical protein
VVSGVPKYDFDKGFIVTLAQSAPLTEKIKNFRNIFAKSS